MKDFTIKDAADEAAANFPGVSREVTRHVCQTVMDYILDIVEHKKGRIRLQHTDIHTIYYDIVPSEVRAMLADLDESRVLTDEESFLTTVERANAKPHLPGKVHWLHNRHKRAHAERFDADSLYPQIRHKGGTGPVREP